jgi:aspartate ammonia-lyase
MNTTEMINFIKEIELFKDLSESELALVAEKLKQKKYPPKAIIFKENVKRTSIYFIVDGQVSLFKQTQFKEEKRLALFKRYDFLGEASLLDEAVHSTSARAESDVEILVLDAKEFQDALKDKQEIILKLVKRIASVVARRMSQANSQVLNLVSEYASGRTRSEHDLLGDRTLPCELYYGVQTLRGIENFNISNVTLNFYPLFIDGLAMVKKAAAKANNELGLMSDEICEAICAACDEIVNGKLHKYFVVDMIQGGAGTSTNMNANEVIANRALEILGHEKGEYQYCHPNNHVNMSQSTNDAYPTSVKVAALNSNKTLVKVLLDLISAFRDKANEFSTVIKMGRTQLQDAVPITLGQEFEAYAITLEEEVERLTQNANLLLEVNMGATAIGTGINTDPGYARRVIGHLREITGLDIVLARNLIEATQDTGVFVMYSSTLKRLAVKLSKICNDLRLMSSGPRCGFGEINLPPMQPGSSIMPGKVNPVIPEVVNQVAFKVIGNDLTVTMACEAGQLELNVMEPIIVQSIFESVEMLKNAMRTLQHLCIEGITANVDVCRAYVMNSIGLVTALNPILGYETSTALAKEALISGRGVAELVLEKGLMSKEQLDEALTPENMIKPKKLTKN